MGKSRYRSIGERNSGCDRTHASHLAYRHGPLDAAAVPKRSGGEECNAWSDTAAVFGARWWGRKAVQTEGHGDGTEGERCQGPRCGFPTRALVECEGPQTVLFV